RSIMLYAADAQDAPAGNQVWDSEDSHYSVLVAVRQDLGVQLNWAHVGSLGSFQGPATYDIYVNDTGVFKPGQSFVAVVTLASGAKLARVAQVGGGASTPVAPVAIASATGTATGTIGGAGSASTQTSGSTQGTTTASTGGTGSAGSGSTTTSTQSSTTSGTT